MKPEIEIILARAEDCLSDAVFNLEHDRLQVAVNRSYYCIFDCVIALLHEQAVFTKTHQGAHTKFHEHYIKTGLLDSELGKMLLLVFELRQSADYDFQYELAEQDVATALDHARTFLAATKSYFGMKE